MLKSINSKLIITMALTTILIIGVFSLFFLNHQYQQLIAEVLRGARIFSDTVTRSTRYDMLLDNRENVHRMIETIGKQDGIDVVRIFNKEGKIMFSTNKNEMETYVDKNAEACYICHAAEAPLERLTTTERSRIFSTKDKRIIAMITPIYNEPDCYKAACHVHSEDQRVLGVLDIGMSLEEVDRDVNKNRVISIIFTLLAIFCVSTITTLFIHRLVTKPVKQLVSATQKVATGDLSVNISVKTNDEISDLAKSFNYMTKDLKKAHEKIQRWNVELEKMVEERTKKLQVAKEKLIQSDKMASMGVLASSVAHEINNPMQGILTYIKLMLKIVSGKELDQKRLAEFKEYLHLMGSETERCGDMVKNLLVFSRQSKLEIRITDVNAIIKNSLVLLENKIRLQSIDVVLDLQEGLPNTYCDFRQIQQTLIALIINAIEAISQEGKIIICTKSLNNKKVEITITDNGSGISKENLNNIFDPFFTTKETEKSTGLGLFVAYGIIQEHNGTIDVKSEIGKGTTFHIVLPVENL